MRLPAAEDLISDHGRSLYDYCSLWLGDKLATINAVRNTFALAVVHQDLYPGHEHLRSWLYAIARVHCMAQPHYGGFTTAPFPPIGATPHGDDTELTANAMGALGRREREVLELIHRHGLSVPAVGLVLGVPTDEAARLALGAQDLVESFVTCVRLAQTGRSVCGVGEPIALDWLDSPRRELRSRLKTHVMTCATCARAANLTVSVPALLARLPIAELDDLARSRIEEPARPESVEIRWSQHDYPLQPDAYDAYEARDGQDALGHRTRAAHRARDAYRAREASNGARDSYAAREASNGARDSYAAREASNGARDSYAAREASNGAHDSYAARDASNGAHDSYGARNAYVDRDAYEAYEASAARDDTPLLNAIPRTNGHHMPEPMFRDSRGRPRSMPLGAPVYEDYYADTDDGHRPSGPSGPHPTEDAWEERRPPAPRQPEEAREGRATPRPWDDRVWENRPVPRLPDRSRDDATPLRTRRPRANVHGIPAPRRPLDDELAPVEEIWDRRITARVPPAVRERSEATTAEVWDENVSSRGKLSRQGTRARAKQRRERRPRPVRVVALGAAALLIVSLAWRGLSARDYHPSGLAIETSGAKLPVAVPQLTKPVPSVSPSPEKRSAAPAAKPTSKPKASPTQRRTQPVSKPVVRPSVKPSVKKPAPAVRPVLSVKPQAIELADGAGVVTFSVNAGTVKWKADSEQDLVEIAPASGTVAAGKKVRLEVGLTDDGLLASSCLFESDDELGVETSVMDVITIRWTGKNEDVAANGRITLTVASCVTP
ncbi:hypothetical protein [Acrocarpospora macrocephala]|nr:hypothetical protein [Acrocarpospora macrocephala]